MKETNISGFPLNICHFTAAQIQFSLWAGHAESSSLSPFLKKLLSICLKIFYFRVLVPMKKLYVK